MSSRFVISLAVAVIMTGCATSSPSGTTSAAPSVSAEQVAATVQEPAVRRLLTALAHDSMEGRRTGTPGIHRAARLIADEMRAIGLEPVADSGFFQRVPLAKTTINGRTRLTVLRSWAAYDSLPADQRVTDANVAGVLRGSDPALRHEFIVVDAHYDHLGVGRPVNGDSVYNGADDDASGIVAVLETARALAKGPRPKRSIIFLAMTGEEMGLLGTQWYVANPLVSLDSTVANLEIEMIGRPDSLAGGAGKAWLTGYERSTMGASFTAAGLPVVADPRPSQNFFMRSDNIAFARRGIPAHTISSFGMHTDYHKPSDDVNVVDFPHLTEVVRMTVRAVQLLANGPAPQWNPGGKP